MERPVVIEEYATDCALQFKVEGLEAKPILDIMIGVNNLKEVDVFIKP